MVPLTVSQEISSPTMLPVSSFCIWRNQVCTMAPVPTYQHVTSPVYVPAVLQCAKFVFIHHNIQCTPLQVHLKVFFWSLRVILRLLRSILGQVGEHIDRLKLAHLDLNRSIQVPLPRRRGRPQVNRPHITTFPFQVP